MKKKWWISHLLVLIEYNSKWPKKNNNCMKSNLKLTISCCEIYRFLFLWFPWFCFADDQLHGRACCWQRIFWHCFPGAYLLQDGIFMWCFAHVFLTSLLLRQNAWKPERRWLSKRSFRINATKIVSCNYCAWWIIRMWSAWSIASSLQRVTMNCFWTWWWNVSLKLCMVFWSIIIVWTRGCLWFTSNYTLIKYVIFLFVR